MTTQCFEAQFRVHPTREHPSFATINFGILFIWIFDQNGESAGKRAKAFAVELPFRIGDGKMFPVGEAEQNETYRVNAIAKASMIGIHFELQWYNHSVNEQEKLKDWPYLVPLLDGKYLNQR